MTKETPNLTIAGLEPREHARRVAEQARGQTQDPTHIYKLVVVDDDIDSDTGVLYEHGGFADPEAAAEYVRYHSPTEYAYGLYTITPYRDPTNDR